MTTPAYRVVYFACEVCGTFQYEVRIPRDLSIREYAPQWCRSLACDSVRFTERVKPAKGAA